MKEDAFAILERKNTRLEPVPAEVYGGIKLSILIPTSQKTKPMLDQLLAILLPQIKELEGQIEIFLEGDPKMAIGAKMNSLLKDATGEYVWFLKDTDLISETAIEDLFAAFLFEPDVVTISGMTTFNHRNPCDWKQGPDCERKPNHNSPMKAEIARLVPFRKSKVEALEVWAKRINTLHPWNSHTEVEKPIIHNRHELTGYTQTRN